MKDTQDGPTGEKGGATREKERVTDGEGVLGRRSCLKLAGAAVAATVGVGATSGAASAGPTAEDFGFARTVNVVEEFDADPSGNEPVDEAFRQAATDGSLVVFPEGEYQFGGQVSLGSLDKLGIVGEGDVTIRPPEGFGGEKGSEKFLLDGVDFSQLLVKNLTVDLGPASNDTSAGVRFRVSGKGLVENMEYVGRAYRPDHEGIAWVAEAATEDAVFAIRNCRSKTSGSLGKYGGGRCGIWAGRSHRGTLRVVNCDIRECGNNAMYTSRCPGDVQVEDSYFENNNVAGVRISGEGSYARNCEVLLDVDRYDGPGDPSEWAKRGMIVEQGPLANGSNPKPEGALVENCDVVVRNAGLCQGAYHLGVRGRTMTVKNSRAHIEQDGVHAVWMARPGGGSAGPAPAPHRVVLDGLHVTGSASEGEVAVIREGSDHVVRNCCITQTGSNRDGITFVDSSGAVVADSNIDVPGKAVVTQNASAETRNLSGGGDCRTASVDGDRGSSSGDGADSSDAGGGAPDSSTDGDLPNVLTIEDERDGRKATYEFGVAGDLEKSDAGAATVDDHDVVDGKTVRGHVYGGTDSYRFDGDLTGISVDGQAKVRVNGEAVDPDSVGADLPHVVVLEGEADDPTTYRLAVSGDVEKAGRADPDEAVEGSVATGLLEGGVDDFRFSGDVRQLNVDGDATVEFDHGA